MDGITPFSSETLIRAFIVDVKALVPEGKDYVPFFPTFEAAELRLIHYGTWLCCFSGPEHEQLRAVMEMVYTEQPGYSSIVFMTMFQTRDGYTAETVHCYTFPAE